MKNVIRRAVSQGATNKVIHTKVNNLAKSKDFVQHLTSNLIKIFHLLCLSAIRWSSMHQFPLPMRSSFTTRVCIKPNKKSKPLYRHHWLGWPQTRHTHRLRKTKTKLKKKKSPLPSKSLNTSKPTCRKRGFNKDYSDDYNVDRHNNRPKGMEKLQAVKKPFVKTMNYKHHWLVKQSQECNRHTSGKILKGAKCTNVQIKSDVFNSSD